MESWIIKNWNIIIFLLISIGVVYGTIRTVLMRIDKETQKLSQAITNLAETVISMQIRMMDKTECEKYQARCGANICDKIDQISNLLSEERTNHRDDIARIFEKIDATKQAFSKSLVAFRRNSP